MKCKAAVLFVVFCLLFACALPAFANGADDKTGSIGLSLLDQTQGGPIVGAEFALYRVADVIINEQGGMSFVYTPDFAEMTMSPNDAELVNGLEQYLSGRTVAAQKMITDEKGSAVCSQLPLGLYFVMQTGLAQGFAECEPFIVTLPAVGEDGLVYEVDASPKANAQRLTSITIKKLWNTASSTKLPESITVLLFDDDELVRTAVLNAQNNWQITYDGMPEGDGYSIKEKDVPQGFTATYSQNKYTFTVTNSTTLVQTGQLVWPIPVLAALGLVLIVLGAVLFGKRGRTNA